MSVIDDHQLVAKYGPDAPAQATALLMLYRMARLAVLREQARLAPDEALNADMRRLRDALGLYTGNPGADEFLERFIEFRVHRLHEMPYKEYLQTPEWQGVRHFALERAGGRCQTCNKSSRLHVHHRTYERRGGEDLDDVTVLCAGCHHAFHDTRKLTR